jgi:predicted enzyme related to lactoylglutathione lyase
MNMSRIIHFEIHADNPERAVAFYQTVFGWQFKKWAGPMEYWLIVTGPEGVPGINGGLLRRHGPAPTEGLPVIGYVCTIQVTNVDQSTAAVTAAGGSIALPKMTIPGVGWLVYCKDTEGNIFGMMQSDATAK